MSLGGLSNVDGKQGIQSTQQTPNVVGAKLVSRTNSQTPSQPTRNIQIGKRPEVSKTAEVEKGKKAEQDVKTAFDSNKPVSSEKVKIISVLRDKNIPKLPEQLKTELFEKVKNSNQVKILNEVNNLEGIQSSKKVELLKDVEFKSILKVDSNPIIKNPKIDLNDADNIKEFVSDFKERTKDSSFSRVHDINKALGGLELAVKSGNTQDKLNALDKCLKEVDKFTEKTTTKESSKGEKVKELSSILQEARKELVDNFVLTDEGKRFFISNKLAELPNVKLSNSNFEDGSEQIKDMVRYIVTKAPDSDFARCMTTSKNRLEDIGNFVNSKFSNLSENKKTALADKINQGFLEGLPNRISKDKNIIVIREKIGKAEYEKFEKNGNVECIKDGNVENYFKYIEYTKQPPLAKGSNGIANLFLSKDGSGQKLVVKEFMGNNALKKFCDEVDSHRLVSGREKHENIADFKGVIFNSTGSEGFAIQEFIDGGNLTDLTGTLKSFNGILSAEDSNLVRKYVAKQVIEGMNFITNDKNLAHLDIKPDNIMFDKTSGNVKIIDFGEVRTEANLEKTKEVGSPAYMSPEMIKGEGVNKKTDVWSTGVALQEIITGDNVFNTSEVEYSWDLKDKINNFINENKSVRNVRASDTFQVSEDVKLDSIDKFKEGISNLKDKKLENLKNTDIIKLTKNGDEISNFLNGKVSIQYKGIFDLAVEGIGLKDGETIRIKKNETGFEFTKGDEKVSITDNNGNFDITKSKITKGKIIGKEKTELSNFINNMVTKKDNRMTFSELAKMPYFTDSIGTDERAKDLLRAMIDSQEAVKENPTLNLKAQFNIEMQKNH